MWCVVKHRITIKEMGCKERNADTRTISKRSRCWTYLSDPFRSPGYPRQRVTQPEVATARQAARAPAEFQDDVSREEQRLRHPEYVPHSQLLTH